MTAVQHPARRLPSTGSSPVPQGYFRSKLFVAPYSTNGLVAAASPLLSLMERLCLTPSLPSLDSIRANIEHELQAFHSQLDASHYTQDLTRLARYLLSATLDELLGKNYLRIYGETAQFNAFTPVTSDNAQPQQRFFDIVNYIEQRPNQYLDLIELVYLCLITGFEGVLHTQADGRQVLDNRIESLYELIQQYRCYQPLRLFQDKPLLPSPAPKIRKTGLIATVLACCLVSLAFFSSHILLENKAKTLLFGHTQLALLDK